MKHLRIIGTIRFSLGSAVFCVLLGFCCISSLALPIATRMSQFSHTSWRIQDGLFSGTPTAIAQTADGYIWLGTTSGLSRFDGIRFVSWTPPAEANISDMSVVSLLSARDGSLWIGTTHGMIRLKGGQATAYRTAPGRVDGIVEDVSGYVWFVRARFRDGKGPLCQVAADRVRCFGAESGINAPFASALALSKGVFWIALYNTLTQWTPNLSRTFEILAAHARQGPGGIQTVLADTDGCMLVGLYSAGADGGLQRLCGGVWRSYSRPELRGSTLDVQTLYRDSDDTVWVGTRSSGLYRVTRSSVEHFQGADGLTGNGVSQFFEDREANLWVVTALGLDKFRPFKVVTYSTAEGLSADSVNSVLAGSNGTVWVSNGTSLDSIDDGHITSIKPGSGLPGNNVTSLLEDHDKRLWVGVDDQLYVYERKRFLRIAPQAHTTFGLVRGLAEDSAHDIWAQTASPDAIVHLRGRKVIESLDRPRLPYVRTIAADPGGGVLLGFQDRGIGRMLGGRLTILTNGPSNQVNSIIGGSDASIWGSSSVGLVAWRAGSGTVFDQKDGLPCTNAYSVSEAKNGDIWMAMSCGFIRIPREQLSRWWIKRPSALKVDLFDALDGSQTGGAPPFAPVASVSPDGKLWFANEGILQVIDPLHIAHNDKPPPVHIEEVVADHTGYSPSTSLRLPAHTRDLEVDYTALSFVIPQKVQFRYKLEGWDADWQNPGSRRQAFYTNLRPGHYLFRVIASNNDDVWNRTGDALSFVITPAFYQTWWFSLCAALAVVGLLYFSYWVRIRQIVGQTKARMLDRLSERERIARELHDSFFQGIQGLLLRFNTGTAQLRPDEPAKSIFLDALQQSDRVMLEGRELVLDLRATATDTSDLPSALARAGEELRDLHPTDFEMVVVGQVRPMRAACAEELYPLGREALYNAFRHAHATKIKVELKYESGVLTLRILDNGDGIDEAILNAGLRAGHWGLPGMQERAKKIGATIAVLSRKGNGTEVEVVIPASIAYVSVQRAGVLGWLHKLSLQADERHD